MGFRPFVYRIASGLGVTGWIGNDASGVVMEAQGSEEQLETLCRRIRHELPPLAVVTSFNRTQLPDMAAETGFRIRESSDGGTVTAQIPPDSAVCPDCLREFHDPADRRYRYPFITCTNCGPRYSIITSIPYDRPGTTMAGFPLCPDCLREYHDPADRRFHAQPVCCPACGPRLSLTAEGGVIAEGAAAADTARQLLAAGRIIAVKGIGGYHLAADAGSHEAVARLRQRKHRDEKPFALMTADLETARRIAQLEEREERLLASPEAPIVIVRSRSGVSLSPLIAPGSGWLGLMFPYTPLHHLLFTGTDAPRILVMTSGNISDEPIACRDGDAVTRLAGIADAILGHNRPIHTRQDDSVIRVFRGEPLFYRRSRGYAPRSCPLPFPVPPLLACGAELKSAVCLASGRQAFLSQYIGDLQNGPTVDAFRETIDHLGALFRITPELAVCDLHPDYLSTRHAEASGLPLIRVQHHHAHLAACMADNRLSGETVGLILDGTGYGGDGTIWGGEFLIGGYGSCTRAAHFRPAPLPGGDAAVRQPWRMALAYLHQLLGDDALGINNPVARQLDDTGRELFRAMLNRGLNSPLTSGCGRLFDAAAALIGIRLQVTYDGQAAAELESLAEQSADSSSYPWRITQEQVDMTPAFAALLQDLEHTVPPADMARRFHTAVAAAAVAMCRRVATDAGLDRVVLSGGVFQNRLLTGMVSAGLAAHGLQVFTHRLTPPNDGCIALGQAAAAGWKQHKGE